MTPDEKLDKQIAIFTAWQQLQERLETTTMTPDERREQYSELFAQLEAVK